MDTDNYTLTLESCSNLGVTYGHFQQYFSYIQAASFTGKGNQNTTDLQQSMYYFWHQSKISNKLYQNMHTSLMTVNIVQYVCGLTLIMFVCVD